MEKVYLLVIMLLTFYVVKKVTSKILDKNISNVTAEEVNKMLRENKDVVVLDVRTKDEFKAGHIPGAKHIPHTDLKSRISDLEQYKDRPIVVYCASGGRSPVAVRTLAKNNFTKIYHMNKGLRSWNYKLKSK